MSDLELTLRVRDLRVDVGATGDDIVDEVTFEIPAGHVLGLVGESGSGKTTVGLAVLGHARRGVQIASGTIQIRDSAMLTLSPQQLRAARGGSVSYVPQDPSTALNPALRIGTQVLEILEHHGFGESRAAREDRVREAMAEVALPNTADFLRRYPHQLSGGQQQRVGLAMAFACRPSVIVLDEPTTGLDVTTQAHVLSTVRDLCRSYGVAALYVTHDLAVVATLADEVAVMYAGRIVEHGPTAEIFTSPRHPYARHLVAAAPDIRGQEAVVGLTGRAPSPGRRPVGCAFAPRCSLAVDRCDHEFPPVEEPEPGHRVRCHLHGEAARLDRPAFADVAGSGGQVPVLSVQDVRVSYTGREVVHGVSFELARGECVALVGESGSGKTTLARSIGGLHAEWTGSVELDGTPLERSARRRPTAQRLAIQYVFQNPYGSLHPRRTIGESVGRPLRIAGVSAGDARSAVAEMLERVALTADYAHRYPDQLSGGERQRVAIARALVSKPSVLVCDEVTSALDVLVQAAVVDLLVELQRDLGLSLLFVTHNLPLVRSLAQHVAVLNEGRLVEFGPTERILSEPSEEYTKRLIGDTPSISAAVS